jgi:NADPH:quinone reductase-like Zn-dependent oxidoreductase
MPRSGRLDLTVAWNDVSRTWEDARRGKGEVQATQRAKVLKPRPLEERAVAVRSFEREVVSALVAGHTGPLVDSIFPADEVKSAFDRLQERGKVGKALVEFT